MKLTRPAIAIAVTGCLVLGATAEAKIKPKPVCNLLTDEAGDAALVGSPAPDPSVETMDIVSADVGTDAKRLSVVIRVKKLAKTSSSAPLGMRWTFGFTAEEYVFSVAAHADPTGALTFDGSYKTVAEKTGHLYAGGVTGSLDLATNEVRINAPISLFAGQATLKVGKSALTDLKASTVLDIVVPDKRPGNSGYILSGGQTNDTATSTKLYKFGTLSCVTPSA